MMDVMKMLDIATLAERWTIAHTLAVAAWVAVAVLGLMVFVRSNVSVYPATNHLKTYAAENATFRYPENWIIRNCESDKPFIELPGAIKSDYKDERNYQLDVYGTTAYNCIKDRPERLDLYSEEIAASSNPCAPASSTEGEQLSNGLYLQLQEESGDVLAIHVRQNSCYAPADTLVLGFAFTDPNPEPGDTAKYGVPRISKEKLLESRQYQDIKAVAQSIKY